jgi:Ni,Fe-hydrogenase III component G
MNLVLNINPSNALGTNSKSFLKKFSILSTVRFDNRVNSTGSIDNWNPIPSALADSMLVSTQTNGRHSLFFMRSDPKFSTDVNYQHLQVKQLLSNGIESRSVQTISQNIRWNFTQEMGIQMQAEVGEKKSEADAFSNRNYAIQRYALLPKLNVQPGTTYKVTVSYRYENKENILKESLGEIANIQDAGVEWRYSTVKKGVITAKFNYVDIKYNSEANSAIGYEMLEGLKTGSNYTWGLSIQRNLGNSLQIGINYDGRKPADVKVIHTGGAQVRAYF